MPEIEQQPRIGAAHREVGGGAVDRGQRRHRAVEVEMRLAGIGVQLDLRAAQRHRRIGREQRARIGEGVALIVAGALEADRIVDVRAGRVDVAEALVGRDLHFRIAVAQRRAGHRGMLDHRHLEGLALLIGVAERPRIVRVGLVPLHVDRGIVEMQPACVIVTEDRADRRDARVDMVGGEEVGLRRAVRVGDGHPVGDELDVDRIEIELEVARHAHLALRQAARDALEAVLEEAALGDEQDRPGEEDQPDQAGEDRQPDAQRRVPAAALARGGGRRRRRRVRLRREGRSHEGIERARNDRVPSCGCTHGGLSL